MNIDYDLRFSCFISITITNMQIRENKNDDEMSRYHHCGPAKSSLSRLLERIPAKIKPEKLRSKNRMIQFYLCKENIYTCIYEIVFENCSGHLKKHKLFVYLVTL